MSIAPLDRRITIGSKPEPFANIKRLSDLADRPYVVLLGEPGLGKTEAFKHFAAAGGLQSEEACLWDPDDLASDGTYFIDAIDEVSIEEARNIARSLKRATGCRWRVSCRAEDWNAGGALSKAFGSGFAAAGVEPIVAQLQPLDENEAIAVLAAIGHPSPPTVISTLQTLNSTSFVMTPLGLRFLMTVKPEHLSEITRYQLYTSGIEHLAIEHNEAKAERATAPSLQAILDTAGRIFLTLLMTGKHGVQRSGKAGSNSLGLAEIDLDSAQINASLDTALFTKRDDEFVPLHRSIQEFLAARFLARLVTDERASVKLHIERALALIVSPDGLPSEAFKPLYAWFACHLVEYGAIADAKRLVTRDPEALLLHGDAAKLPWNFRAHILREMGKRDPYFRWTADQWRPVNSCTAGLITPELKEQVLLILGSETSPHRLFTVLEALAAGCSLPEAAELCWQVLLRESASFWCKEAAVVAWAKCAKPSDQLIWKGMGELASDLEILSADRSRLIAQLFCLIPADRLTVQDVVTVLDHLRSVAGYVQSGPVAGAQGLTRLSSVAVPVFYAIRTISGHVAVPHLWRELILENPKRWRISHGVGSLDQRFASALCTAVLTHDTDVTIDEFAKMMLATGNIIAADSTQGNSSLAAEWVAARTNPSDIAQALLLAGDEDVADAGPIAAGLRGLGLRPNSELINWMLTDEQLLEKLGPGYVGRQVANWVLEQNDEVPSWLTELLNRLDDSEAVMAVRGSIAEHSMGLERTRVRYVDPVEDQLLKKIPEWAAEVSSIESGECAEALYWAAEIYCGNSPFTLANQGGPQALQGAFGEQLGQSMLTGLAHALLVDQQSQRRMLINAASAAVLLERQSEALQSLAVEQVLEIYFATDHMRYAQAKANLENYCVERLSQALVQEPTILNPVAEAGDARWSSLLHKLMNQPTKSPLHQWTARVALAHPENLYGETLHSVLVIARLNLDEDELLPLINTVLNKPIPEQNHSALESVNPLAANRLVWAFIGATVKPDLFADHLAQCLEKVDSITLRDQLIVNFEGLITGLGPAVVLAISSRLMRALIQRDPQMGLYNGPQWPDVMKVLRSISSQDLPQAEAILQDLVERSKDTRWIDSLQHQVELHRRDRRTQSMKSISAEELRKVLSGKGPIDAQDLRALVIIVLEDIAAQMQPSPFSPWKHYWKSGGSDLTPKTENDCRDVLAEKLLDNLRQFGSFEVQPEVASSGATRADIVVTDGNFAVPIEAKRTNHTHLWYGHTGQLQTYALANNAGAQGIYLVFWFGKGLTVTGSPSGEAPTTPENLKDALERRLSPALLGTTSVVVLDVSNASDAAKVRKDSEFEQDKAAKSKPGRKPASEKKPPTRSKTAERKKNGSPATAVIRP